jgi:hypothetical protein
MELYLFIIDFFLFIRSYILIENYCQKINDKIIPNFTKFLKILRQDTY